jgi:hypothetical protein
MNIKLKRPKENIKQLKTSDIKDLRDSLLRDQNFICPICGQEILDPVLDHSHTKRIHGNGQVRGVIHRMCNVFLAKAENNCVRYGIGQANLPHVLRSIADYLEKPPLPFLHPSEKPKESKLTKLSYNRLKKFYEGNAKFPEYPKSGKLTVKLKQLFDQYRIKPEFYAK